MAAATEDFSGRVAAKLAELSGEKPTVSEHDLATALMLDPGEDEMANLAAALDELATASVAVQVGTNAENGRMWRHTGMDEAEAQRALDRERETAEREAAEAEAADRDADEAAALERAAEIERERGVGDEDGGDDLALDDVDGEHPAAAPARAPRPASEAVQRVELPMALVGSLSNEAVAELVTTGVEQAKEAGVGFQFIVTP